MSSSSKKSSSSKPFSRNAGDWTCPDKSCGNLNFARRDHCNRCETAKPKDDSKKSIEIGHAAAKNSRGLFSADDWSCLKCGNINWARRGSCNICNAKKLADENAVRTGYGGGYNERDVVEYKDRESSDSEYDEFGRRKKRQDDRKSMSSKRSSRRRSRTRSRSRSRDRRSRSRSSYSSSSSSSSDRSRRKRSRKSSRDRSSPSKRDRSSPSKRDRSSPSKRDRSSPSKRDRSSPPRHDRKSSSSETEPRRLETPTSNTNSKAPPKESRPPSSDEEEEESGSDEDLSKYNLFDDDDLELEALKKGN